MTKIDLITGILGSGKTTFIRKYAAHLLSKGLRIAILENDFGAVNVDMMMLSDLSSDNCELAMITGGGDPDCHKRRFKTQLISLGMQHFDRVMIEPSGIFDIDEFFDTLYESPLDRWFEIGSVITVIDAQTEDILPEQYEYLFASEAACCGKLVLSKLSAIEVGQREQTAQSCITHLNRALEGIQCSRRFSVSDMIVKEWDSLTDSDYNIIMNAGYRSCGYVKQFTTDNIGSEVHYFLHIDIESEKIAGVLSDIMNDSACGDIRRIKGSVSDGGKWFEINVTKEKMQIIPISEGQSVLIVIGENIDRKRIDSKIQMHNTDSEYVSI